MREIISLTGVSISFHLDHSLTIYSLRGKQWHKHRNKKKTRKHGKEPEKLSSLDQIPLELLDL